MRALWWSVIATVVLAACGRVDSELVSKPVVLNMQQKETPAAFMPPVEVPLHSAPMVEDVQADRADVNVRRYLAVSHSIELEVKAAEQVETTLSDLTKGVMQANGEILSSRFERNDRVNPSATLAFRLLPATVEPFFARIRGQGVIVSQGTESEDKTAEVVDVDAKLKNLTESRDRMRKLLAEKPGKLADIVELEKALTETQSELDSIVGRRKVLAKQTDMVRMTLEIHATRSIAERSAWMPLKDAWESSGFVFFSSLGHLLSALIALVPWAIPVGVLVWWAKRRWAKRKARAAAQ
ncbi:DUF4349 domain-containing protein [Burkholderiaceae bacterium DAT-1]|nr:DUF4349 domain-containing protein [Burkholderiaceae bacterium DAT-1]